MTVTVAPRMIFSVKLPVLWSTDCTVPTARGRPAKKWRLKEACPSWPHGALQAPVAEVEVVHTAWLFGLLLCIAAWAIPRAAATQATTIAASSATRRSASAAACACAQPDSPTAHGCRQPSVRLHCGDVVATSPGLGAA